jgi:hypothetical protein
VISVGQDETRRQATPFDAVASGGMAKTKLIIEITTRDDKTLRYECVDFPTYGNDFITLYKKDFVREQIRTESVLGVKQFFK